MATTTAEVYGELEVLRKQHHASTDTDTARQRQARADEIESLKETYNALLADGAKPCRVCGSLPKVRLRTPEFVKKGGLKSLAVYEACCRTCLVAARAAGTSDEGCLVIAEQTAEAVVAKWNQEKAAGPQP